MRSRYNIGMHDQSQPSFGAPTPTAYPTGKRSLWVSLAYGCSAGCGLFLVVFVVIVVYTAQRGTGLSKQADLTARQFMDNVQARQADKAYDMTSTTWRKNSTFVDFKTFMNIWREQQGDFRAISLKGTSWFSGTGGSNVNLQYDIQGSHSDGQVKMVLVSDAKGLSIQSCTFTPR
jgi:hypothetical protein